MRGDALAGEDLGAEASALRAALQTWAMRRLAASISAATLSCVMARSHSPVMQKSWNRKTRSLASEGLALMAFFRAVRASSTFPWRSSSSACIRLVPFS